MVLTYSDEGFETSRETIQQIREYGYLSTSAHGHAGMNSAKVLLADDSAQAGCDTSSYYLLWGVTAVTNQTNAAKTFAGIVYHGDAGVTDWVHTNDTPGVSTILQVGAHAGGPLYWMRHQPVSVPAGTGVNWDPYGSTTSQGNLLIVYYTLVK